MRRQGFSTSCGLRLSSWRRREQPSRSYSSQSCPEHPSDFMPCRPWGAVGDRKNDGYLKSERLLFQVYAPNELKVSQTIAKIREDFTEALRQWKDHFDTWVFVHNTTAGLPPDVMSTLLDLQQHHPHITVTHWGFEELVLRFRKLSSDAL